MQPDAAKLKLVQSWLERAHEDLAAADRLVQEPPLSGAAAFHAQQATEKVLKAYLGWRDVPGRKIHELLELLADCGEVDAGFASLVPAAKQLSPCAVEPRYPSRTPTPSPQEAEEALRLAREVMEFVTLRLPPEASA
jgi:HEPN domain-containing protein